MAYTGSKSIAIDSTKVGASNSTNFPFLFSGTYAYLATIANGGDVTSASGYDIIFTSDASGTTLLNWEIESYDPVTGTVNIWVKVPTVSHTVDTAIYVFYGNAAVVTFQGGAVGSVWDANFGAVYHFGPSLTADSTVNANNGTNTSATAVTGEIDGGANFATNPSYIDIPNAASLQLSTALTLSAWVKGTSAGSIVVKLTVPHGYGFTVDTTPQTIIGGSTLGIQYNNAVTPLDGNWHYFVLDYAASAIAMYQDGALLSINSSANIPASIIDSGTDAFIAAAFPGFGMAQWTGSLDEVRISNIARSADWITAEFNNQSSPSTFYTLAFLPSPTAVNLLSNATVAVSAGSTVVNTGNTILYGDLDLSPGSVVSGFPPGIVTGGVQHIDDATAVQSQLDVTTAYNQAASAGGAVTIASALDAVTLYPGVYTAGTFSLSGGTLTLDALGDPNAVWIFQMSTTLITSAGSVVQVINGGQAKNVFWQVGSSATIGATNTFVGTILASASITVTSSGTTIAGGLLANAAVNLGDATVTVVAPPNPPSRVYNTAPGTSPINTPFSVSLLATDNFDVPSAVTQDTGILLTVYTGTGVLSGTVTGTILSGQSTATISGVMYNVAEAGVSFFATSTSGDSLAHFINGTTTTFTGPSGFNVSGSLGIAGAGITISYSGTSSGSVKADAFGNYTIFLPSGTYIITPGLYNFIPASMTVTVNNANITGVNFLLHYSEPDCRNFATFPNLPVNVNGTLTYTVPSVDSRKAGAPVDSRVSKPVDCRVSPNIPENSRAPGTFGPNE